jgi:hypothetical protein
VPPRCHLKRVPSSFSTSPPAAARPAHLARSKSGSRNLGGNYYVIAEYPTSHWVENLRSHTDVGVRVAGETFAARARILSPERDGELHRAIQELSRKKYGWGEGVVVELRIGT